MIINYSETKSSAFSGTTTINNSVLIDKLLKASNSCIKVYLFALMQYQNPFFENEDVSLSLGMEEKEITDTFIELQAMGLLRVLRYDPLHIEFCGKDAFSTVFNTDQTKYSSMIKPLREVLGTRVFSATEMKTLYDWIEVFGLSEDAAVEIVAYAIKLKGKRVSVNYMDKIAKDFADMNIVTAEDVRNHIEEYSKEVDAVKEIKKRWRIVRNPTQDELELYRKWTATQKIPENIILAACSEMVFASNPTFGYLDSVLQSYVEKGLTDINSLTAFRKEQIENEEFTRKLLSNAGITKKPTLQQQDKVSLWRKSWHIQDDALLFLAKKSAEASRPFDFMSKTASKWNEQDIRNIESAKNDLENPIKNLKGHTKDILPRREYTDEEYENIGCDFSFDLIKNNED